jgi:hypothetical protein
MPEARRMVERNHTHPGNDSGVVHPIGRLAPVAPFEFSMWSCGVLRSAFSRTAKAPSLGSPKTTAFRAGVNGVLAVDHVPALVAPEGVGLRLFSEHAVIGILQRKAGANDPGIGPP